MQQISKITQEFLLTAQVGEDYYISQITTLITNRRHCNTVNIISILHKGWRKAAVKKELYCGMTVRNY